MYKDLCVLDVEAAAAGELILALSCCRDTIIGRQRVNELSSSDVKMSFDYDKCGKKVAYWK